MGGTCAGRGGPVPAVQQTGPRLHGNNRLTKMVLIPIIFALWRRPWSYIQQHISVTGAPQLRYFHRRIARKRYRLPLKIKRLLIGTLVLFPDVLGGNRITRLFDSGVSAWRSCTVTQTWRDILLFHPQGKPVLLLVHFPCFPNRTAAIQLGVWRTVSMDAKPSPG